MKRFVSFLVAALTTILMLSVSASCSRKLTEAAFNEVDILANSKSQGYDYAINVLSPHKQMVINGKYDTVTPMRFTEVMQDSLSQFELIYIDDSPIKFMAEGNNTLRCIYPCFDTSFYSVKFENVGLQQGRISFDLVIAGNTVAQVAAYTFDGESIPKNIGGLLTLDGSGNKLLQRIASLIQPIDFLLGDDYTITAGTVNDSENGNAAGGNNYPCVNPQSLSLLCVNAALLQAEMIGLMSYRNYIHHGECHNGCTYYAY